MKVTAELQIRYFSAGQREESLHIRVDEGHRHFEQNIPLVTDRFRSDFELLMGHLTKTIGERFKRKEEST